MQSLAELADFLRAERTRQRLSQSKFAARAGISLRSYQRLEAADPGARLSSFLRACMALGFAIHVTPARRPTLDELGAIYGHDGTHEPKAHCGFRPFPKRGGKVTNEMIDRLRLNAHVPGDLAQGTGPDDLHDAVDTGAQVGREAR